ncbi:MAG: phosphoglycerate mutase (2,3-diphosphoglycerate-independent) [Rickettsiales bacterium]|nr:phosphoglycerate mutase (2,3-diphosphoglycerate-independent) [Rickettsiales bacterium]
MNIFTPVILCILDGWGHSEATEHNAIAMANTPHWDRLMQAYPNGLLDASEGEVGLPSGQMGNSEVGHMNIGSGRVVMQDLPRIDQAIADDALANNAVLQAHIAALQASGGTCHLMGLVSDGGVHAHQNHIIALAKIVANAGVPVAIHAFLDGRDTPPKSADGYVKALEDAIADTPLIAIATLSGRYYAMDRDQRWDRVSKAYNAICHGDAPNFDSATNAIASAYTDSSDEFVIPCILQEYGGMTDGDGLLMANFRADRARQLMQAFVNPAFDGFDKGDAPHLISTVGMVEYSSELAEFMPALFPPQTLKNTLGEVLANHNKRQLRIAETEKYAHVTFFMNGGREAVFDGEERILVPSPDVATYDLQPEMSAPEVTNKLVEAITSKRFDAIMVNYANTDMVGHTGDTQAAIKAVETVDACLGRLLEAIEATGGAMLITADHGNAEQMKAETGEQAHTAHTLNKVPLVLAGPAFHGKSVRLAEGRLADLAPSMLALLHITQPAEMTGKNLIPDALQEEARARA